MEVTWADEIREEGREKGLEQGLEKGREEGREQGREEGLVAGKRETLLHLLATKFGTLPGETALRVQAMESPDELDRYLDRLLTAKSLDEMGFGNTAA